MTQTRIGGIKVKGMIWTDYYQDFDHWKENLHEMYPDYSDDELYQLMQELNSSYLDDERCNLNIELDENILVIADLGLWNGRRTGYKEIGSNIRYCLSSDCDFNTWYIDGYMNLRCEAIHHDGKNYYLYREWKPGLSEAQKERFKWKLYEGKATSKDLCSYTRKLGDRIADVYGW